MFQADAADNDARAVPKSNRHETHLDTVLNQEYDALCARIEQPRKECMTYRTVRFRV